MLHRKWLKKLKNNKASGPHDVAPKLLKRAGDTLIPSLLSPFYISVSCNVVRTAWEFARVSALLKKDDETDKKND